GDYGAVAWAVGGMIVVILLYDQLVFRPVVAWADKFRFETTAASDEPTSWLYDVLRRARLLQRIGRPLGRLQHAVQTLPLHAPVRLPKPKDPRVGKAADVGWTLLVLGLAAWGAWLVAGYISHFLHWRDVATAFGLGLLTLTRVIVLIAL